MKIKVRNKKWSEEVFLKVRQDVLSMWPTGKEVDLDEVIEYQKGLPESRCFSKVVDKLRREGKTVVFPRAGTPILEHEIELNKTLKNAGLLMAPVTPDSYSRLCQFDKASQALGESIKTGQPKLNGYPTVVHGVKATRKMTESNELAYNQRITNLDGRLMAEIAFASGITAALVDPILSFGCYEKNATAEQCIISYQYIHRLIGYYADRGVTLTVDIDGWTPSFVFPLGVVWAGEIAVALIAAEQGVKSIIPWSFMMGHMAQDIAWARMLRRLVREYLDKFGYKDVATPGLFISQTPGFPFPQDMSWAFAFTNYSAVVASLAKGEAVYLRTIDEAAGIPTGEAHAMTYRSAKWIFDVVRPQTEDLQDKEIDLEEKMSEVETRAIVDKLLELGDGDIAIGYEMGVRTGVIDWPITPNVNVKENVLGIRDNKGACRYLTFGNIPVPEEVKEFHRERVAAREKAERRKMDYRVALEDFWAFSKGRLVGIPSA